MTAHVPQIAPPVPLTRVQAGRRRISKLGALLAVAARFACCWPVSSEAQLYTDTGIPSNPPWSAIVPTLNVDSPDPGPVYGSLINVNNAAVEVGLYGNRPISVPSLRIHVACNTSTTNFANFTRWFQIDGKTHVLRVFVDDENTATTRTGTSSHTEAFSAEGWNFTDNVTYEWTGHYTIARLKQGYACFQLKNSDNDWAVQLSMGGDGSLTVNNRRSPDAIVTNPDGSVKNFNGGGFDVRVLDDGNSYMVWIDGDLYATSSYSRPTGTTNFRWGMYFGANNLNPPADYNLILVSGVQVKSWPGNLATAVTAIVKGNNTQNLENTASWTGSVVPGRYNQAVWNSTVTGANTTTLASDQDWAGIKIVNPGGLVTINGTATLGLDASGVDLSGATRSLVVNCPVELNASSTWTVGAGQTAKFNGAVRGYAGITSSGAGTLVMSGANTYTGPTTINDGEIQIGASGAINPVTIANAGFETPTVSGWQYAPSGTGWSFSSAGIDHNSGTWYPTTGGHEGVQAAFIQGSGMISKSITVGTAGLYAITFQAEGRSGTYGPDGIIVQVDGATAGIWDASAVSQSQWQNYQATVNLTAGSHTLTLVGNNTLGGDRGVAIDNVQLFQPTSLGSLPSTTAVNLNASGGTLDLSGVAQTIGSLAGGAGSSVINNGSLTAGGDDTSTAFAGAISGKGSFTKTGAGQLTLGAANTYTGPTTVSAGTLAFSDVSTFDSTSALKLSGGTTLQPTVSGATIIAPITVGGTGTTASISAPTNLPGAGAVCTLALSGAIGGAGNVTLTSSANQNALSTVLLNAPGTYLGSTLVDTNGTANTQIIVKLGTTNALPTTTVVTIDGQAGQGTGRFADMNLNGFNQKIAGLTNNPRSLRVQRIVNSDASAPATLTINNSASYTFSGTLGGAANGSVSPSAMPGSTNGNNFGLSKSGAGTFTASGANIYSGNTTVSQGILSLGSANPNNNTATVTISATNATLDLNFTGTDTVNKLFVGNSQKAAGVYGAVGSALPVIGIPQISGPGTLTVTSGPLVGFASWQSTNGTNQTLDQDHDNDGVPNGIEYFIGGPNGNTTGFTALPSVIQAADGTRSITWTKAAAYPGTYGTGGFVVETADTLAGAWTIEPAAPAATATVTFPTPTTVKFTFPAGARTKFARLKVM